MPDAPIVAGKYRLIAKISEGGMGAVWSAEHLELNCPAAVKLLSSAFADSPETLARFKREAQAAASLRSTNIVQILDFGIDRGAPYIAMELLQGHTLAAHLSLHGRITPREAAIILSQVARAVTWAHGMGIIHRDLKPGNIFLSQDAGETVVKLLDFGIAKPMGFSVSEAPVTLTGTIVGTPQYMSPEQASGRRTVDHRTDIWSFGIVAYECITGRRAFETDTLGGLMLAICSDPLPVPSKVADVPRGFDEWFARCAHRDPERRFLSISEAADVLRFVCGLDVNAFVGVPQLYSEPPSSPYTTPRPPSTVHQENSRSSLTDAPSTITLGQFTKRGVPFPRYLILGLLFVTGAAVAVWLHLGSGNASPTSGLSPTTDLAIASAALVAAEGPREPPSDVKLVNAEAHAPLIVTLPVAGSANRDVEPPFAAEPAPKPFPRHAVQQKGADGRPSVGGRGAHASNEPTPPAVTQGARARQPAAATDPAGQPESTVTVEQVIGLRRRP